jgi:hypothetical protein
MQHLPLAMLKGHKATVEQLCAAGIGTFFDLEVFLGFHPEPKTRNAKLIRFGLNEDQIIQFFVAVEALEKTFEAVDPNNALPPPQYLFLDDCLDDENKAITSGSLTLLTGPSGSGKTLFAFLNQAKHRCLSYRKDPSHQTNPAGRLLLRIQSFGSPRHLWKPAEPWTKSFESNRRRQGLRALRVCLPD